MRTRVPCVVAAALLLAVPVAAQEWRGPLSLEVRVEDAKGKNVERAEILLTYLAPDGGALPSMLTDGRGEAVIGGLAAGRWNLEIRHAGHMTYRAELVLSDASKPQILSASQLMAPGATSTLKVKLARGRGGSPPPVRPVAGAPLPKPTAVEPAAAPVSPAPTAAASKPAAPPAGSPVAKPSATVAVEPAPAPSPVAPPPTSPGAAVAPPSGPIQEERVEKSTAVLAVVPAAPTAPAPAAEPASLQRVPELQAPVPPTPTPDSKPVAPPPEAPTRIAPVPPVAEAKPPAPAAVPAAPPLVSARVSLPPSRPRLCVECPAGESASWAETTIPVGDAAGCPADLPGRLESVALDEIDGLAATLGQGCRLLVAELPAGARYTGFRYESQSPALTADCLPGRGCPAGDCQFPWPPVVRRDGKRTLLLAAFASGAAEPRRAVLAGYSTFEKKR